MTTDTQALVRNHIVLTSPSGLITLAGGKWTTYRAMAEDAVDEAVRQASLSPERLCCTKQLKLVGAHGWHPLLHVELVQRFGLITETARHCAATYGDQAVALLSLSKPSGKRWPKNGKLLDNWYPYTDAEVRFAVRHEMAQTPADVVFRRTRIATLNVHAAKGCLKQVVEIMAEELGWDKGRTEREYRVALAQLKKRYMTSLDQALDRSQSLPSSNPISPDRSGGGL